MQNSEEQRMDVCNKAVGVLGLLISSFTSVVGAVEDEPIAPDRPGLSTGTYTVSPGTVYIEAGYQYEFNRSGVDTSTSTFPQLVFRTGLSDKFELDIVWDGWNRDNVQGIPNESSQADLIIGGKYRLIESEDFNLTLLGLITAPVGSSPSTSDNVDPLLGLLWDYALTDKAGLFGVFQSTSLEDENENSFVENQLGLGFSYSYTDKLASFIEYFTAAPQLSGQDEQHILDAGLTYLYSNNIQLDISAGVGLNDETSHFISFGVAARF
jgi:hypothetical protein